MKIKKDVEYAIIGLVSLASKDSCSVSTIAKENKISPTFLAKIFQKLSKAGIVSSKYGPGGGYTLAKSSNLITFYDIIAAVQPNEIKKIFEFKASAKATPKSYMDKIIIGANKKISDEFKKINLRHFMFYFMS